MNDDQIDEILKDHRELFKSLADSILCPGCKKVTTGPKHNLGEAFHWAEGCEACAAGTAKV